MFCAVTIGFACEFAVGGGLSAFKTDKSGLIPLDKYCVSHRRNPIVTAIVYPR